VIKFGLGSSAIGAEAEVPETRATTSALSVLQMKCGHLAAGPIPALKFCLLKWRLSENGLAVGKDWHRGDIGLAPFDRLPE